jgi:hypothetical protein
MAENSFIGKSESQWRYGGNQIYMQEIAQVDLNFSQIGPKPFTIGGKNGLDTLLQSIDSIAYIESLMKINKKVIKVNLRSK